MFFADAGNDDPQAVGNPDGKPRNNKIYENAIYSGKDLAWLVVDAEDNDFYVSAVFRECTYVAVRTTRKK